MLCLLAAAPACMRPMIEKLKDTRDCECFALIHIQICIAGPYNSTEYIDRDALRGISILFLHPTITVYLNWDIYFCLDPLQSETDGLFLNRSECCWLDRHAKILACLSHPLSHTPPITPPPSYTHIRTRSPSIREWYSDNESCFTLKLRTDCSCAQLSAGAHDQMSTCTHACTYVSAVVYASLQHLAVPLSVYVNTVPAVSMQPGDSHFWSDLMKVKDQFL
jgi:hypothetical protein